jgi:DNA-binding NtrC family response regulator
METRLETHVLIVDDEVGPRESLRMILKPNYRVHCVENGHEAIRMVQQAKMDVVLLDLRMPGISGMDTLKAIKGIDPDVRVIIITAYGTLESSIDAVRYGVFDYVLKPFNVPEILSRIERAARSRFN